MLVVLLIADVDGTKVTESLVVVEYLEEKYKEQGTQLISSKPAHAAKVNDERMQPCKAKP